MSSSEKYGNQGPVLIMDEKGVYPENLNRAIEEQANQFQGYHKFPTEDGEGTGSFQVFHSRQDYDVGDKEHGWYWWACFPGCLPDGEPNGPFPTSEGAYLDAIGD